MKKLVLFATAIVALSFVSCSNKAKEEATTPVDTTAVAPIETPVAPVDTTTVDTPVDTTAVK